MDNTKTFTVTDLISIYCNNGYAISPKANGLYSVYHFNSGTTVDDVDLSDIADTCNEVMKAYHEQGNYITKQETVAIVIRMYEYYNKNVR